MTVRFVVPTTSQKAFLVDLAVESHDIYGTRKADLTITRNVFDIPDLAFSQRTIEVLEVNNEILGFYCIEVGSDYETELTHLFVKAGHQRKGLGSLLFKRCLETARSIGKSEVLSWISDPDSVIFYEKYGADCVGVAGNLLNPGVPVSVMNISLVDEDQS